ncbi:MAG: collagen-like protein [Synechococcales cyanobacterium K44_A2020_017]|nr:collagen-like protein [Synechococcales cyanobacterium K32_A2020_035]MBF2094594.1 collagen-like protein [Synechococcales cyanobacterium K44_A2020_017]
MGRIRNLVVGCGVAVLGILSIPAIAQEVCLAQTYGQSSNARRYGTDGTDGFRGREGRSGQDGQSRTLVLDGSPVNLNLSGTDGGDGDDGGNGRSAFCGWQPRDRSDVRAANGGQGGDGGDGGNGGNGGSVTVYYTDPTQLRSLSVIAAGGRAGRGGRPGYGAAGCRCERSYWEEEVCTGTPGSANRSCRTERYRCRDGADGRNGQSGREGRPGQLGRLTLVQQAEPLAPDNPNITFSLSRFQQQPVSLSRNIWATRRGASTLLASGSIVADEYREFVERAEQTVQLNWAAERSLSEVANESLGLELLENQSVRVTVPEDVWLVGDLQYEESVATYTVSELVLRSEATQLAVGEFSGSGADLQLSVVDLADKSDVVATRFELRYRSTEDRFGDRGRFGTRYEGEVPAEWVTQNFNRFSIDLGQLPIDARYRQSGVRVEIELKAIRSLGGQSAEQTMSWRGSI